VAEPFAYQDYRKKKIRQKIEADREDRVKATKNLPTVNKELAAKLMQNNAPVSVSNMPLNPVLSYEHVNCNNCSKLYHLKWLFWCKIV